MAEGAQKKLCELYDAGLFDLDGVLYRGKESIPYAAETLARIRQGGFTAVFVTNNASRIPEVIASQLVNLGIEAHPDDILSSAHIGVKLAQSLCGEHARVLLCGAEGLYQAAREAGLNIVESADDKPEAVIHGFSPEMNWERLSEAVLAIRAGARYITTNLDRLIPRERGLMMGVGSLATAVTHATGVTPISGAKPEPQMFRHAAEKAGAHTPLVIGDNLDTDIKGAHASGFPSLHVLTGTHTARDIIFAAPDMRPSYLADDVRCLDEPYPDIEPSDEAPHGTDLIRVRAGESIAECNGTEITIGQNTYALDEQHEETITVTLNEYRALVHALWLWLDTHPTDRRTIERYMPEVKVRRS
ncbi:MAG: HAD-IIA family hydrolase [Actinomycetaceae bacterium]|nr:HAD-IIA family hydrolase [Actinomycetaceae bacterium]